MLLKGLSSARRKFYYHELCWFVSLDKNKIMLLEEMITTLAQLVSYPSKHENFTISNIA